MPYSAWILLPWAGPRLGGFYPKGMGELYRGWAGPVNRRSPPPAPRAVGKRMSRRIPVLGWVAGGSWGEGSLRAQPAEAAGVFPTPWPLGSGRRRGGGKIQVTEILRRLFYHGSGFSGGNAGDQLVAVVRPPFSSDAIVEEISRKCSTTSGSKCRPEQRIISFTAYLWDEPFR